MDTTQEAGNDSYDRGFREGYRVGELERITLATANSELRSEILELKNCVRRLEILLDRQTYAPTQEYVPHHTPVESNVSPIALLSRVDL